MVPCQWHPQIGQRSHPTKALFAAELVHVGRRANSRLRHRHQFADRARSAVDAAGVISDERGSARVLRLPRSVRVVGEGGEV